MDKKYFIRCVYWYGATLDGIVGVFMVISMFTKTLIIPYSSTSTEYQFAMGYAAALMFGWTVLLFWGGLKPIERKNILLMTICPVVVGLILTEFFVDFNGLANIWLYQLIGCIIPLTMSYLLTLKNEK
jgi:hypothetical protein